MQALCLGGGSAGTSVLGPESQEGLCESLKDPISIAIDFFKNCFGIFNYFLFI
jgi:hypothetical protein